MSGAPSKGQAWQRLAPWLLLLLAFALNWPYLLAGFQADDFLFINALNENVPFSRWRGFWSMPDPPCFTNLWWLEETFQRGFWRPLPSLVFEGSLKLFGEVAFPLHLLSILLHGGVAACLFLFVRRLTALPLLALLAALIFVTCEDHSLAVGWIAAITDLLCVQLIMLSLLAHLSWLQRRRRAALLGAVVALVLALGCKETAAVAPLILVLLTFFAPTGTMALDGEWTKVRARLGAFLRDWVSWAPGIAVLLVFLAVYRGLHLGGMNNLMYLSPFESPERYLPHLVAHLPVMWLATLSVARPAVSMFFPQALAPFAVAGALFFCAWLAALWPLRRQRLVWWALLVYLGALLPQLGTDASDRALYLPMIPASVLLALLVTRIGPIARRVAADLPGAPRLTRLFGWWVLGGVLILGAALSAAFPFVFGKVMSHPEQGALTALPHVRQRRPDHVLLLTTAGLMVTYYPGDVLSHRLGRRIDVRVLSSANGRWQLRRTGARSFELRTDRPGWLSNFFARMVRTEPRLSLHRRYANDLFTATLTELTGDATDALAVRFDLKLPPDDPRVLLLNWNGHAFVPFDLSAHPLGREILLVDNSNVLKSML